MTLSSGARLGPYEILAPIGAGGMGEVYRARDERLKRDVAIKVLPVSFSTDPERLRRFEQDIRFVGSNLRNCRLPCLGVVSQTPTKNPDGWITAKNLIRDG